MPVAVVIILDVIYLALFLLLVIFVIRGVVLSGRRADQAQSALIEIARRAQENAHLAAEASTNITRFFADFRAAERERVSALAGEVTTEPVHRVPVLDAQDAPDTPDIPDVPDTPDA